MDQNSFVTVEELTEVNSSLSTVYRHLQVLGIVSKLGKWVPNELTENHQHQRVNICTAVHSCQKNSPFLNCLVTGDEKWILYKNVKCQHQWVSAGEQLRPQLKQDLHSCKVLLSVWWNMFGVIHFKILPPNQTITAQSYCDQLDRLNEMLKKKRSSLVNCKDVIFHHDNVGPHSARVMCSKIEKLIWEKLLHPPYSLNIAPSDYYLF